MTPRQDPVEDPLTGRQAEPDPTADTEPMAAVSVDTPAETDQQTERVSAAGSRRRRWLAWTSVGLVLLLAAGGGAYLMWRPADGAPGDSSSKDAGSSTATVVRRTLTAQTQLNGTLGYAGARQVTVPSGTSATALRQAEDTVNGDRGTLSADKTSVDDTARSGRQSVNAAAATVSSARHTLAEAVKAKRSACRAGSSPACTQAQQQVASDRDQLTQARGSLASAKAQATAANHQAAAKVSADEAALASARANLEQSRRSVANSGATYTAIDAVGTTVKRGQRLYALDGVTVPLFYGTVIPWRALYLGVGSGADVAVLNRNLAALGYGDWLAGSREFTTATRDAVEAWQRDVGAAPTGVLALGDVVYRAGPVVVTATTATPGQAAQPGGIVLTTSSTGRVVSVSLEAAQQGQVKAGDKVVVTLPNGKTVPAKVASVGTVATSGSSGKATIGVTIRLANTKATSRAVSGLDKAPVLVAVTTATVENALVVPVNALLALAGGGYAVEVVDTNGRHRLVGVTLGTFDDANGLVQVSGTDLEAGQRVVVPSS